MFVTASNVSNGLKSEIGTPIIVVENYNSLPVLGDSLECIVEDYKQKDKPDIILGKIATVNKVFRCYIPNINLDEDNNNGCISKSFPCLQFNDLDYILKLNIISYYNLWKNEKLTLNDLNKEIRQEVMNDLRLTERTLSDFYDKEPEIIKLIFSIKSILNIKNSIDNGEKDIIYPFYNICFNFNINYNVVKDIERYNKIINNDKNNKKVMAFTGLNLRSVVETEMEITINNFTKTAGTSKNPYNKSTFYPVDQLNCENINKYFGRIYEVMLKNTYEKYLSIFKNNKNTEISKLKEGINKISKTTLSDEDKEVVLDSISEIDDNLINLFSKNTYFSPKDKMIKTTYNCISVINQPFAFNNKVDTSIIKKNNLNQYNYTKFMEDKQVSNSLNYEEVIETVNNYISNSPLFNISEPSNNEKKLVDSNIPVQLINNMVYSNLCTQNSESLKIKDMNLYMFYRISALYRLGVSNKVINKMKDYIYMAKAPEDERKEYNQEYLNRLYNENKPYNKINIVNSGFLYNLFVEYNKIHNGFNLSIIASPIIKISKGASSDIKIKFYFNIIEISDIITYSGLSSRKNIIDIDNM